MQAERYGHHLGQMQFANSASTQASEPIQTMPKSAAELARERAELIKNSSISNKPISKSKLPMTTAAIVNTKTGGTYYGTSGEHEFQDDNGETIVDARPSLDNLHPELNERLSTIENHPNAQDVRVVGKNAEPKIKSLISSAR